MKRHIKNTDHEIGVAKPSTRQLPPKDHVYGLPYRRDKYGAGIGKIIRKIKNTNYSH